jgi:NADPH:quinone reductase-like Zn-dependent oxidoreductase
MKRIQYNTYGDPGVMRLAEFDPMPPKKGEVSVYVKFAAINPIDWKLRNGQMKIVTGNAFPRAMGMDFSGIVTSIGEGVTRFKQGDAVFGLARLKESGAFGQEVVTKELFLAKKPSDVSFEHAAYLGTPGVTAWNGLVDKARLKPGQHVFINGCIGAVGQAAVQIARHLGATVSGSCSAQDMDAAHALGLLHAYDYRKTDLSTIETKFDVVYDTAATMRISTGLSMLRPGGVFLDLNPNPGKMLRALVDRRLKIILCSPQPPILEKIASLAEEKKFLLPIGEVVPLSDAIQLITELEFGRKLGGKGILAME